MNAPVEVPTHKRLGASARHRWMLCPASVKESEKYPDRKSGPAAIDGTHTHTLLEHCLKTATWDNVAQHIGWSLTDHDGTFIVDKERAERVQFACDYILQRRLEGSVKEVMSETKVCPERIFKRDDIGGSIDTALIGADMIEIIDYKDGMDGVSAENNPQLEIYGFGLVDHLMDDNFKLPPNIKTIRLTIIQPKLRAMGKVGISYQDVPIMEFLMKEQEIVKQLAATDDPNAPFVPGDSQCKYCPAKGGCSALNKHVMDKAGITFPNLDVAQQAADKDPTQLSDDQLREMVEAAPLLRKMLEAAEIEALRRFESGHTIEGLKVVRGRGSRSWAFDEAEMEAIFKKMGVPKEAMYTTDLISPAKAEKLVWKNRKGDEKRLSEKQLALLKTEYIKSSQGKLTIVPAADERSAVTLGAASLFKPVEPVLPSWLS